MGAGAKMGQCVVMRAVQPAVDTGAAEFLCVLAVPSAQYATVHADPVGWIWNGRDPAKTLERVWLDGHAPGWTIEAVDGEWHELEDATGAPAFYMDIHVSIVFATAAHQAAWHGYQRAVEVDSMRLYRRIARRLTEASEGVEICVECGGTMHRTARPGTIRVAQFAFVCTAPDLLCEDCGCHEPTASNTDIMEEARSLAARRVGLPMMGHPLWTPEIGAAWQEREDCEPALTIAVEPGMSAEAIVAALDATLAAQGRVFGGRPRLVAA